MFRLRAVQRRFGRGGVCRTLCTAAPESPRVAFFGSGEGGARCLEMLLDASLGPAGGFDVVLAATHPPTRGRRGRPPTPSLVAEVAERHGVPVETGSAREAPFLDMLRGLRPCVAVTAAYRRSAGRRLAHEADDTHL